MNTVILLQYIGTGLAALLVLFVIFSIIRNIIRRKRKKAVEKDFIFSPKTAEKLRDVKTGIQFESTIVSLLGLIIGTLLMVIYIAFFTGQSLIMKGFLVFNAICGIGLLSSMLVTQYQQFVMYTMSEKIMDNINSIIGDTTTPIDQNMVVSEKEQMDVYNQLNTEGGKT